MFKIGDFSKFSRVSIKMLRHYDEIGLLKPAQVDPFTNYRYYSADQLPRLNRIIALKDLGFSLEQIATLLDDALPASEIRGMLKLKRAEIATRVREEQTRLEQVEGRLRQIELEDGVPVYDVVLRKIAPQIVAGIRAVVKADSGDITAMFEEIEAYVARYNARETAPPLTIYHDADYRDDDIDVEIAVPVNAVIPATERVHIREVEAVATMACVVHKGDYISIAEAYTSLFGWIATHDYTISGALREVYLRFGADNVGYRLPDAYLTTTAGEFVTELQVPVSKEESK
ncbi:MAG: MerR family transcriptional regulator [Aggregatilineales bacterium]